MATSTLQELTKARLSALFSDVNCIENYRPDWLHNPDSGYNLELDFYLPDFLIAIEVQGRQHKEYTPYFHTNEQEFKMQIHRDQLKAQLCKQRGILLYEVWQPQDIEGFLREAAQLNPDLPFHALHKKHHAISLLGELAAQLILERRKRERDHGRVTVLTKKILHICQTYRIPISGVRADFAVRNKDRAYFGHANIRLHWYEEDDTIHNAQRAVIMKLSEDHVILRIKDGAGELDVEFDTRTGRPINQQGTINGWRFDPQKLPQETQRTINKTGLLFGMEKS